MRKFFGVAPKRPGAIHVRRADIGGTGTGRAAAARRLGTVLACAALLAGACGSPANDGGGPYVPPPTQPDAPPLPGKTVTPPPRDAPRSAVPPELQGTWSGGTSGGTAYGSVTLGPEGDLIIVKGRLRWVGTVVVERGRMTFYIPGSAPRQESWSWQDCQYPGGFGYPYRTLSLSGYSYVQDC
ncbi:hypothetical protein [Nonomuraea zeae]|uniref:Uncharacterized protein n=1 Tax=Nonomuraea zeae TaxID=1642303 RepID=A0A5S4GN52_9ACTN|nr:hypothetical protein [Nonomuraea zeae]TMR34212.1 hypothetical protein ETD85_17365 [Nonomuraea zeae]